MRKFCMPLFNRATYGRMMELIRRIEETEDISLTLWLYGALVDKKYGEAANYIRKNHRNTEVVLGKTHPMDEQKEIIHTSWGIVDRFGDFLSKREFDGVIVVADRFETLPAAMVASYLNFIVIHIQGGEVTGNIDEKVRHAVTKLSDFHFVATKLARKYVVDMGEHTDCVFFTGCPSLDVIKKLGIRRFTPKLRYIMCIFHPDTNSNTQYEETKQVLEAVVDYCERHATICHWYWPNPDPGREEIIELLKEAHKKHSKFIKQAINEEPFEFLRRLSGARFILGNSSVGIRECSYMGVPAINIGGRQSLRERSWNVIDVSPEKYGIMNAMEAQRLQKKYKCSYLFGTRGSTLIINHLRDLKLYPKRPLQYPLSPKYMEEHCGETRLKKHAGTSKARVTPKRLRQI